MKRSALVALMIFLFFANTTFYVITPVKSEDQDLGFIIRSSVTFFNNGTSVWNFTEEDQSIGLFMNNTWQTVCLTNHSHPIKQIKTDEEGNPVAVLRFSESKIRPNETLSYNVTYQALSKSRPPLNVSEEKSGNLDEIPESMSEEYTKAEGPWLVNDSTLQTLAHTVAKDETNILTIVKKFVEWIKDNITYVVHDVPLYPNETYTKREGDCDDQAILLITLCRICGIPAYLQTGCIYIPTKPKELSTYWEDHLTILKRRIGWHGWAMVHVPPWGWLPVDLTYVWGGLGGDALNSIKKAAVTSQWTIQYMNFSKTDYAASAREEMEFFLDNSFHVHVEDEMIQCIQGSFEGEDAQGGLGGGEWLQLVLVATAITVVVAGFFIYIRTRRRAATPMNPPHKN